MKKFGHGFRAKKKWFSSSYVHACRDRFGYIKPSLGRKRNNRLSFKLSILNELNKLGIAIGSKPNVNESSIPAGYTYLGQFIDHDITFDPFSKIDQKQDPETIPNMRIPCLDLDSVYGRGPSVDPFLYVQNSRDDQEDGIKLLIGQNKNRGPGGGPADVTVVPTDFDVPRNSVNTAIIGDPRNNENLIVSQLHHAVLKFHNRIVDDLKGTIPDENLFEEARKVVILHYQWIVLNDFLPRICIPEFVDEAKVCQMYFTRRYFKMPVEFAVAAYRFGHSMIRSDYNVNSKFSNATLMQVFDFARDPDNLPVHSNWAVDFNRFFNTGVGPFDFANEGNLANSIDTALAPTLNALPDVTPGLMERLASRNLQRGLALQLTYAQALANSMGVATLTDAELLLNATVDEQSALQANNNELLEKTPLWYYILKEAEVKQNGERLGELGSFILAEVFTRILRDDAESILNTDFTPHIPRIDGSVGDFEMADLLHHAGVLEQ